ncbi:hypothetical protein H9660_15155 [Clostridium sp. Sa3CUN1]|uniref:Uncharacterized protein n=1 Tax=Clostridium gallinarum TaxID=2762246 RepID=A0ABR8Q7S3_9CLOT|nr:hypothetical protein [Clostridium gallinarum]MBD7916481.1 hypothetical protein [Clostridium gallinarum]
MIDIGLLDTNENQFINYINSELLNGRQMKDIEINDFKVNDRVIVKRLVRRGYKRVENELNINDEKGKLIKIFIKNDKFEETIVQSKNNKNKQNDSSNAIVVHDENIKIKENNIDIKEIVELIDKKEEIFRMLEMFNNMSDKMGDNLSDSIENKSNNIIIKLPNPKDNQFKATIRLNDVVWEQFKIFTNQYPFFTTKDLVSQALVDFMNKHS